MNKQKESKLDEAFRGEFGNTNLYPDSLAAAPTQFENIFTSHEIKINLNRAFGGQFIGNAISALSQTVPDDVVIHSLHGYFINAGEFIPSTIKIIPRRSGKSFETRSCTITQKDKVIFTALASFQKPEVSFSYQYSFRENIPKSFISRLGLPIESYEEVNLWGNIERRSIASDERNDLYLYKFLPTVEKDDWRVNTTLLGFMTDIYLHRTVIKNFKDIERAQLLLPSLDHSIHFHKPRKIYVIDSGRILFTSRIFNFEEELLASITQEMLLRIKNKL
eukprot:maker-scaffold_26-snap-gene-4.3-mRNA-1 protein AED:0.02 eAED:0.02 QI:53/0.5/0.66/1/1/1/3/88/276